MKSLSITFLFLYISPNNIHAQAESYLIIGGDDYEIKYSQPMVSSDETYYELRDGKIPKEVNTVQEPVSDVTIFFHIDQFLCDNEYYNNDIESLIQDLNRLVRLHHHPYKYNFTEDGDMSGLDITRLSTKKRKCVGSKKKNYNFDEIHVYISIDMLPTGVLARSYYGTGIIAARSGIMNNYQWLAHEIYHQLSEGFCDNEHGCNSGTKNILQSSLFICNYQFDVTQLRKMIDQEFQYDYSNGNQLTFPLSNECICNDYFDGSNHKSANDNNENKYYNLIEQITQGDEIVDDTILDKGIMKEFIYTNFINGDKDSFFKSLVDSTVNNSVQKTLLLSDKEFAEYHERKIKGTKSLIHDNVVQILKSGIERKKAPISNNPKINFNIKELFEAYYNN